MSDPVPPLTAPTRHSAGPRRSEASHAAILDAAEAILAERGSGGLTFEAVARRAGAGKPTLYRWWPNRTALLLEVYDRRKHRELPDHDTGDLAGDLLAVLADLWRFWRETPAGRAYAGIIAEAQQDDAARAVIAGQWTAPNFSLTPIFDRALARGDLTDAGEALTLREYVAAMNWFRLLTGRLDPADLPGLVATLIAGRTARRG
ncbi:TetR/AcrR family transcriptional regulator [Siculibacillus lacustris]|uniref:TetR/AcrR family transcriptional regulator n=1 Tax=Siculibacillus lacustris TaxID=1549641 RepID=A0A4Q9VYC7_9HYPH|nr:TetR/AcrR family transcriptional regulator [Siculibacillus lacustris]TBW40428.1 TetR/AcrR family transcriptional regulator [Siculibacillus lacustris]